MTDEFTLKVDVYSRLPYEQKCCDINTGNIYDIAPYGADAHTVNPRYIIEGQLKPILFPISCMISEIKVQGRVLIPFIELARIEGCLHRDPILEEIKNNYGTSAFIIKDKHGECFEYYCNDLAFYKNTADGSKIDYVYESLALYDWMNEYMIDYRGLIRKGLAISVFDLKENPYE